MRKYKGKLDQVLVKFIGINFAQATLLSLISLSIMIYVLGHSNSASLPKVGACYASEKSTYASISKVNSIQKGTDVSKYTIYYSTFDFSEHRQGMSLDWDAPPTTTWQRYDSFFHSSEAFYEETGLEVDCLLFDTVESLYRIELIVLLLYRELGR